MDVKRDVLASSEGTADPGGMAADPIIGDTETGNNLAMVDVDPLAGDVQIETAFAIRDGQPGLGPERRLVLGRRFVVALDDDGSSGGRVAAADGHLSKDFACSRGRLGISRRLEWLPFSNDCRSGPAGGLQVVGRHHRDRFAPVASFAVAEDRLVLVVLTKEGKAGHIVLREHGVDSVHGQRRADIKAGQASVGMGAAHGGAPQHAGREQVRGVGEVAGDLGDTVGAKHTLTDPAHNPTACLGGHDRPSSARASRPRRIAP